MKRLLAGLLVALMLTGIALSVSADPIDVGGNFTSFTSGLRGPAADGPRSPGFIVLCSPIDVGGN